MSKETKLPSIGLISFYLLIISIIGVVFYLQASANIQNQVYNTKNENELTNILKKINSNIFNLDIICKKAEEFEMNCKEINKYQECCAGTKISTL